MYLKTKLIIDKRPEHSRTHEKINLSDHKAISHNSPTIKTSHLVTPQNHDLISRQNWSSCSNNRTSKVSNTNNGYSLIAFIKAMLYPRQKVIRNSNITHRSDLMKEFGINYWLVNWVKYINIIYFNLLCSKRDEVC